MTRDSTLQTDKPRMAYDTPAEQALPKALSESDHFVSTKRPGFAPDSKPAPDKKLSDETVFVEKTENINDTIGLLGAKSLERSADRFNRFSKAYVSLCDDNRCALMEVSQSMTCVLGHMNKTMIDSLDQSMREITNLSNQARTCTTTDEINDLQGKTFEQMGETLRSTSELYTHMYKAFVKIIEPFSKQTLTAGERLIKAMTP